MVLCRALVHAGDVLQRHAALRTGRVLLDQPLTKRVLPGHAGERTVPAAEGDASGQHALTVVQLRGVRRGVGWLELRPLTGRKHQLRAHCTWTLGTPIVADGKYRGGSEKFDIQGLGLPRRLHLHCRSIAFPHPFGGRIDVRAPLPPHMRQSWAALGFAPDEDAH